MNASELDGDDVIVGGAGIDKIDSGEVGREPGELMQEVETWIEQKMRELDPEAYGDAGR